MTVLTRDVLLAELEAGRLRVDPLTPDQVGPASIDLTLGDEIRVIVPGADPIPLSEDVDYRDWTQRQPLEPGFVLDPGVTVHGITLERIELAEDLCGLLEGRSRFARLGLMIHVTSALVQPGVRNRQVLEISNVSGRALALYPGVRICQLVVMRAEGRAEYRGRFSDQERL
ncbi:MAG: dCTP deaminase [Myxococcota bacterium]